MRWLIVEDALKDRKGHWLEWVTTFDRGFRDLGDEVTVLADAAVEKDICDSLRAEAILPHSIWHRLGNGSGPLTRVQPGVCPQLANVAGDETLCAQSPGV